MGSYLVQDPHHPYVAKFVEVIRAKYGHRPIAYFTDRKARFYRRNELTTPREAFAATYELDGPLDAPSFAAMIRARHPDLVGVLPYSEEALDNTVALLPHLGLDWNDAATVGLFRDKVALKAHVARTAPGVRLNLSMNVTSAAQLIGLGTALPPKFILKPADGFGSRGVGVFTWQQLDAVKAFFRAAPGRYVLEEFLDGPLYCVDGLVDVSGEAHIAGVFSSGRRSLNGSDVVYSDGYLIHQDTELFSSLTSYARSVMRATGLTRSPFHMEVIVDSRGPCLVEVGARLIGATHAFTLQSVHRQWDVFGSAAQAYFTHELPAPPDYAHYNSLQAAKVFGATEQDAVVYSVDGDVEVSRLPQFERWVIKPHVGQKLTPTRDLFTLPYHLVLVGERDGEPLADVAARIHRTLHFNGEPAALNRLRVDAALFGRKVQSKLGYLAENALRTLRPVP